MSERTHATARSPGWAPFERIPGCNRNLPGCYFRSVGSGVHLLRIDDVEAPARFAEDRDPAHRHPPGVSARLLRPRGAGATVALGRGRSGRGRVVGRSTGPPAREVERVRRSVLHAAGQRRHHPGRRRLRAGRREPPAVRPPAQLAGPRLPRDAQRPDQDPAVDHLVRGVHVRQHERRMARPPDRADDRRAGAEGTRVRRPQQGRPVAEHGDGGLRGLDDGKVHHGGGHRAAARRRHQVDGPPAEAPPPVQPRLVHRRAQRRPVVLVLRPPVRRARGLPAYPRGEGHPAPRRARGPLRPA